MGIHRRTVLAGLGCLVPSALAGRGFSAGPGFAQAPALQVRSFEESLRAALPAAVRAETGDLVARGVEVGHSELVASGLQGCHNDRPFARYPARHLRIVRAGSEPGPLVGGVRLYVCTVDVAVAPFASSQGGRPLDFNLIPPAAVLVPGAAVAASVDGRGRVAAASQRV